jgi:hypothetical protein
MVGNRVREKSNMKSCLFGLMMMELLLIEIGKTFTEVGLGKHQVNKSYLRRLLGM